MFFWASQFLFTALWGIFLLLNILTLDLFWVILTYKLGFTLIYYNWVMRNKPIRILSMLRVAQKENTRFKKAIRKESIPSGCLKNTMIYFYYL